MEESKNFIILFPIILFLLGIIATFWATLKSFKHTEKWTLKAVADSKQSYYKSNLISQINTIRSQSYIFKNERAKGLSQLENIEDETLNLLELHQLSHVLGQIFRDTILGPINDLLYFTNEQTINLILDVKFLKISNTSHDLSQFFELDLLNLKRNSLYSLNFPLRYNTDYFYLHFPFTNQTISSLINSVELHLLENINTNPKI